ncbi:hypothetical protein E2542_SST27377 [Spatholobus suberectus]|nr:hypothetical protein E2542_SST27377 [Spatholobus suberectus]
MNLQQWPSCVNHRTAVTMRVPLASKPPELLRLITSSENQLVLRFPLHNGPNLRENWVEPMNL